MCLPSDVAYNYPYNIIVCHMSINCIAYAYPYISAFLLAIVTTNSYSWLLCYYDLHARLLSLYYCAYVLSILSVLSAHINLVSSRSDLSQSNSNSNSSFFFTFNSVSALSISALSQFQLQLQPRHCAFGPGDLELDRVYVYLTFELFWICIRPNSSQRVNVVTHSLLLCGVLLVAGHVPALRFFPTAMILSFTGVLLIYGSLEARTLHLRISDSTRLFSTWCRYDVMTPAITICLHITTVLRFGFLQFDFIYARLRHVSSCPGYYLINPLSIVTFSFSLRSFPTENKLEGSYVNVLLDHVLLALRMLRYRMDSSADAIDGFIYFWYLIQIRIFYLSVL